MTQVPPYDPQLVEAKWQERWVREHTNEPDIDRPARPFYNLMMFPYPSAEGLHVGNMFAFTGADIYGRFKRLQGHDVFEPIGFDAFGIHSENYAIAIGTHPGTLIPHNLERLDWSDSTRTLQHNWIGRSEGAELVFETPAGQKLIVFTTRPDTVFGATYMVLAPEHPLVDTLTAEEQRSAVRAYQRQAAAKDVVARRVG